MPGDCSVDWFSFIWVIFDGPLMLYLKITHLNRKKGTIISECTVYCGIYISFLSCNLVCWYVCSILASFAVIQVEIFRSAYLLGLLKIKGHGKTKCQQAKLACSVVGQIEAKSMLEKGVWPILSIKTFALKQMIIMIGLAGRFFLLLFCIFLCFISNGTIFKQILVPVATPLCAKGGKGSGDLQHLECC